jgi:tripartite-type tricarboxylate transporter receptor subunit TctC
MLVHRLTQYSGARLIFRLKYRSIEEEAMLKHPRRFLIAAIQFIIFTCVIATASVAHAEYPTKPIKWIVMWPVGGGMDSYTRAFTKALEKELRQRIIIQNITGGAGAIGYSAAKAATPDGYTVVTISSDMLRYKLMGTADIGVNDFDIVAGFAYHTPILVVRSDSPFKTLQDFIAAAKAKPDTLKVGVSDIGGFHHVPLMELEDSAGFKVRAIAHQGTAAITAALMGGNIDVAVSSLKPTIPYMEEKRVRVLAQFGTAPLPALPNVPSVKQAGYDAVWGAYGGFGTPKGVSPEIRAKLLSAVKKAWGNPGFNRTLQNLGMTVVREGPDEYRKTLLDLLDRQRKVLQQLGLTKN